MADTKLNPPPMLPQVLDEESMQQYVIQLSEWMVYATRYINDNI